MNWSTESKIGIVTQSFKPESKHCLELKPGDVVITKGSSNGWFKGTIYNSELKEKRGFFPVQNIFLADTKVNRVSRRDFNASERKFDFEKHLLEKQLELPAGSWWETEMKHPLFKEAMDVFVDWSKHFAPLSEV
jgi:hypothetical protein